MSRLAPYRFEGRTAVLTGAASGIGEQLAHQLAERGSDLVLLDRDAAGLAAVEQAVRAAHPGRAVQTLVVDLAEREAATAAAERILAEHPSIGLLVNNAGVALAGTFEQLTLEEFDWVMRINFEAPVLLTHHLLPALFAEPGAHLVNVSSLYGLIAPPGQSAYSASKFALRGFSEVLRSELSVRKVGVTTVHPGGIATRVASSARVAAGAPQEATRKQLAAFDRVLTYPPDRAARQILDGVAGRRGRVLISASAVLPDVMARLFPSSYLVPMGWFARAMARASRRRGR